MRGSFLFTILTMLACSPVNPVNLPSKTVSEPSARSHDVVTAAGDDQTPRVAQESQELRVRVVEPVRVPVVGKIAPRVQGAAHDGAIIDTDTLRGHYVVLYFYPKDETPGCTKQACAFRDAWKDLSKDGAVMIGISADSDESHRKFVSRYKLPFLLLSDTDGSLAAKFEVPVNKGRTARQTIVIAPDGTVKRIYRKVDVSAHAQEVLSDLK